MKVLNPTPEHVHFGEIVQLPELLLANTQRSQEDTQELEEQILTEGHIINPLIVWKRPLPKKDDFELVLTDGFCRIGIVKRLHELADFSPIVPVVYGEFSSIEEIKYWIGINQSSRRSLTDQERMYYHGQLLEKLKDRDQLEIYLKAKGRGMVERPNVAEIVMDIHHVGKTYIFEANQFYLGIEKIKKANEELGNKILTGEIKNRKGERVAVKKEFVRKFSALNFSRQVKDLEDLTAVLKTKEKNKKVEDKKTSAGQTEESDGGPQPKDISLAKKQADTIQQHTKRFLENPSTELLDEIKSQMEAYLKTAGHQKKRVAA